MARRLPSVRVLSILILLAGCGGDGSDDGAGADTSEFAGLWDASGVGNGIGEPLDERYIGISDDGVHTLYDYRRDAVSDEGNCYRITRRDMVLVERQSPVVTLAPQEDSVPGGEGLVSIYRLEGGQRFVAFLESGDRLFVDSDALGFGTMERVAGLSTEDLEPCGD